MAKMYTGKRTHGTVTVEVITYQQGIKVRKRKLRHIPFHSPSGLSWGYEGSGPADLALAILVDYLTERPPAKGWLDRKRFDHWTIKSKAWRLHQPFKRDFVAAFNEEWELSDTQIEKWLNDETVKQDLRNNYGKEEAWSSSTPEKNS